MKLKTYQENWDIESIPEEVILSRAGQINSARRETHAGGRPISNPKAVANRRYNANYRARKATKAAAKLGE